MLRPEQRVYLRTAPLVTLGFLVLAFISTHSSFEHIGVGFILGTMFGHVTVAAAWTALGPSRVTVRLPLSLLWIACLLVAFACNLTLHSGPSPDIVVVQGICLLGQWLILQLVLWTLVLGCGLRLRHQSESNRPFDPRERQFGIRQLMVFTAIVGVTLGIGRAVVTNLLKDNLLGGEAPIFIFLAIGAFLITLPLMLATLLPRHSLIASLLVLVLIGTATVWELPLLLTFHGGGGPDALHLVWINAFTAAWVLILGATARLNGFQLSGQASSGATAQ